MSDRDLSKRNLRTALTFLSVALLFFVGVVAAHLLGTNGAGITILGLAVFAFLVVVIGRSIRSNS